MGQVICHNDGRYNIYSTIADGFYFESSLSLDELKEYIKDNRGSTGLKELDGRLYRAHSTGHSSLEGGSLDDYLCCNRAGENEKRLTTEQCIAQFLS